LQDNNYETVIKLLQSHVSDLEFLNQQLNS